MATASPCRAAARGLLLLSAAALLALPAAAPAADRTVIGELFSQDG